MINNLIIYMNIILPTCSININRGKSPLPTPFNTDHPRILVNIIYIKKLYVHKILVI